MIGYTAIVLGGLVFYSGVLKAGDSRHIQALVGSEEEFQDPEEFTEKVDHICYILSGKKESQKMKQWVLGYQVYIRVKGSAMARFIQNNIDSRDQTSGMFKGVHDILAFCYIKALNMHPNSFELWISYIYFMSDILKHPRDAHEKLEVLKRRIPRFTFGQKITLSICEINLENEIYSKDIHESDYKSYGTNLDINPKSQEFMRSMESSGNAFQQLWHLLEEDMPGLVKLRNALLKCYNKILVTQR